MGNAPKVSGKLGMTKSARRAANIAGMETNRKRDKARQRSSYRSAFHNAPGPAPFNPRACGFVKSPEPKAPPPVEPYIAGSWRHLHGTSPAYGAPIV